MPRSKLVAIALLSTGIGAASLITAPLAAADPPDAARQAACDFGDVAGTYDFDRFSEHVGRMLTVTTGEFRSEFEQYHAGIESSAQAAHARSAADSVQCDVLSGDANQAKVAVEVARTVVSDETGNQPTPATMSMTVTVDNVDGRWLASNVDSH
ncbi:hypothetical protein [Nocardia callitridis]|uniref:Mce-associated membrane protein n=1 Tax=Nocardia callitridis TaxID=648753 RepID=A0ABP9KKC8_9NOCA